MYQVEVDAAAAELLERLPQPRVHLVAPVGGVVELRHEEQFVRRGARLPQGLADLILVAITLGSVDQAVAETDGRRSGLGALPGLVGTVVEGMRHLEHPQAEEGHGAAAAQRDGGAQAVQGRSLR